MKNLRQNKQMRGFTMLEIMVALGLSSIVILGVASILNYAGQGQRTIQAAEDARAVTAEIGSLLSNGSACAQTLNGHNPAAGATVLPIMDKDGVTQRYISGKSYGLGGQSITLTSAILGGVGTDSNTNIKKNITSDATHGTALLKITWNINGAAGHSSVGTSTIYRYILIDYTKSGANIIGCSAQKSGVSPKSGSGKVDTAGNDYFPVWVGRVGLGNSAILQSSSGYVGINKKNPAYALDIEGDMNASGCYKRNSVQVLGACSSDIILKKEIHNFPMGLKEILQLHTKYFKFNGLGGELESKNDQIGYIAQEVELVAPTLVSEKEVYLHKGDKKLTAIKTLDYGALSYMAMNAVREFYLQHIKEKQKILINIEQQRKFSEKRTIEIEGSINKAKDFWNRSQFIDLCQHNKNAEACAP